MFIITAYIWAVPYRTVPKITVSNPPNGCFMTCFAVNQSNRRLLLRVQEVVAVVVEWTVNSECTLLYCSVSYSMGMFVLRYKHMTGPINIFSRGKKMSDEACFLGFCMWWCSVSMVICTSTAGQGVLSGGFAMVVLQ